MNYFRSRLIVALLSTTASAATAQMGGGPGHGHLGGRGPMGPPAFLEKLFPPQLVMRNQDEIGLSDDQRSTISQAMVDTQKSMVDLQWQMESESSKLEKLLQPATVDEKAFTAQADRVMAVETQIKKTHLSLLVRIKNVLTDEQQQKLRDLRPKGIGFGVPAPPPGDMNE